MIFTKFATYTALSLTYLSVALGYIPGLSFNHATIAFAGFVILDSFGCGESIGNDGDQRQPYITWLF